MLKKRLDFSIFLYSNFLEFNSKIFELDTKNLNKNMEKFSPFFIICDQRCV